VGRKMPPLLKPFDVELGVFDPYLTADDAASYGAKKMELNDLLGWSDIISIHAPNTPETKNMLNLNNLCLIKPGALLVNTARAAIIDELALLGELKKGRFKAALDVFWKEPLPKDHELRRIPGVLITPHNVASVIKQRSEQVEMVIDDIKLYLEGKTPIYNITKEIYRIMA